MCTSGLINSSGKQIDKLQKEKASSANCRRGSFIGEMKTTNNDQSGSVN